MINKKGKYVRYKGNLSPIKTINYHKYDNTFLIRREPNNQRYYLEADNDGQLYDYLLTSLIKKKQYNLMKYGKKKLTLSDIQKELRLRLKLVKKRMPDGSLLLMTYSYSNKYWVLFQDMLYEILAEINDCDELEFPVSDYDYTVKQTLISLSKLRDEKLNLEEFNVAPDHLILFKNGVFDNKSKTFVNKKEYSQYHFTKGLHWDLLRIEDANKLYIRIAEKIIKDWSDGDEEKEKLIWQIISATIEGNGRGKAIILKSDGGGGKTSFLNILKAIVGIQKVLDCGIYELNNDNKLANLKGDTHLVVGDDADTNKKLPPLSLSRLKSLTDSGSFLIDVKYQASRPVSTNALFIQNTNTDMSIYENNQALLSRIMKIEWTNENFRETKNELDYDLKSLIGNTSDEKTINKEFIEAIISLAIYNVPYFKQFTIPESVKADTQNMLNENDQVKDYVDFLNEQGVLDLPYINVSTEHKRYELRLADINPSAKPLKIKNFIKEFEKHLTKKGFIKCPERKYPTSFSLLDYNNVAINNITDYTLNEKKKIKANYYYNSHNKIQLNKSGQYDLKVDNAKDVMLYYYLAYELTDVDILEKYNNTFEE